MGGGCVAIEIEKKTGWGCCVSWAKEGGRDGRVGPPKKKEDTKKNFPNQRHAAFGGRERAAACSTYRLLALLALDILDANLVALRDGRKAQLARQIMARKNRAKTTADKRLITHLSFYGQKIIWARKLYMGGEGRGEEGWEGVGGGEGKRRSQVRLPCETNTGKGGLDPMKMRSYAPLAGTG